MDCPKGVQKFWEGRLLKWKKAKGWTNLCQFQRTNRCPCKCLLGEGERSVGGNVATFFPIDESGRYSQRDDAIFAWIKIIFSRNEPF
jgi:hypothetical protein